MEQEERLSLAVGFVVQFYAVGGDEVSGGVIVAVGLGLDEGRSVDCDGLFAFIGVVPAEAGGEEGAFFQVEPVFVEGGGVVFEAEVG